jgi:hypothetical protein
MARIFTTVLLPQMAASNREYVQAARPARDILPTGKEIVPREFWLSTWARLGFNAPA